MMSPSQLAAVCCRHPAGASISNGLVATITLQHCISTTATSTALAIADDAITRASVRLGDEASKCDCSADETIDGWSWLLLVYYTLLEFE